MVGLQTASAAVAASAGRRLVEEGHAIIDAFLGAEAIAACLADVLALYRSGAGPFVLGRTGGGSTSKLAEAVVRGDRIAVLGDEERAPVPSIEGLLLEADRLVAAMADGVPELRRVASRSHPMLACYPGDGARYVKHVDNPGGQANGRLLTLLVYLNEAWEPAHGGQLALHRADGSTVEVAPLLDRCCCFWSDHRTPHEVLPSHRERWAISVWYHVAATGSPGSVAAGGAASAEAGATTSVLSFGGRDGGGQLLRALAALDEPREDAPAGSSVREVVLQGGVRLQLEGSAAAALTMGALVATSRDRGGEWEPCGRRVLDLSGGGVAIALATLGAKHVCIADGAAELELGSRNVRRNLTPYQRRSVSVVALEWADGEGVEWRPPADVAMREFDWIVSAGLAGGAARDGALRGRKLLELLRTSPAARLLLSLAAGACLRPGSASDCAPDGPSDCAPDCALLRALHESCDIRAEAEASGGSGASVWRAALRAEHASADPRWLRAQARRRPMQVACGGYHMLGVSACAGGTLYSAGGNVDHGAGFGIGTYVLGHGEASGAAVVEPRLVQTLWCVRVREVAAGRLHSLLLTQAGAVFSWGEGAHGKLGHGDLRGRLVPQPISALAAVRAVQVACGDEFSLVVCSRGEVHTFGANECGQLGRAAADEALPAPVGLAAVDILEVSGGGTHALAVSAEGRLYSWGSGASGALGHGDEEPAPRPRSVEHLAGVAVRCCAAGDEFSIAIDADGGLWSWGCGGEGRLGHGDEADRCAPARVVALGAVRARAASAGADHAVVLAEDGDVYTMGCGEEGQLGHGDRRDELRPRRVGDADGLAGPMVEVHAGASTTMAVAATSGTLYAWGCGAGGRLGLGDEAGRLTPRAVERLEGSYPGHNDFAFRASAEDEG